MLEKGRGRVCVCEREKVHVCEKDSLCERERARESEPASMRGRGIEMLEREGDRQTETRRQRCTLASATSVITIRLKIPPLDYFIGFSIQSPTATDFGLRTLVFIMYTHVIITRTKGSQLCVYKLTEPTDS